MSTRLILDENSNLKEERSRELPEQPAAIRVLATIISYLFHPVFVPVYVVAFYIYSQRFMFAAFSEHQRFLVIIQALLMYSFFPIVTVLLLKGLKFIQSIQLKTQKDRIIPLVACGVWYFWIWYVWRNLPDYPVFLTHLSMSVFLASSIALLANIYMKISLHAISMGVLLTLFFYLSFANAGAFGLYLSIAIFLTGLVCTARLIVSDHTLAELYGGLATGVAAVFIADFFT